MKIIIDVNSDLSNTVVPYEIAKALKTFGFPQNSVFDYSNDDYLCSAYTFEEIIKFIPYQIDLSDKFYLAERDDFSKHYTSEYDTFAEVFYQKLEIEALAVCRYKGKMIAFSEDNGMYNNLLCRGENLTEAAALMLIKLYKEGKIYKI